MIEPRALIAFVGIRPVCPDPACARAHVEQSTHRRFLASAFCHSRSVKPFFILLTSQTPHFLGTGRPFFGGIVQPFLVCSLYWPNTSVPRRSRVPRCTVQRLHNTHSHQKTDVIINLWHPRRLTGPQHRTHRPLATRKRREGTESSRSSAPTGDPRPCMLASPPPTNEQILRFFTYTAALSALMPASCTTPLQLASLGFRARLASAS